MRVVDIWLVSVDNIDGVGVGWGAVIEGEVVSVLLSMDSYLCRSYALRSKLKALCNNQQPDDA